MILDEQSRGRAIDYGLHLAGVGYDRVRSLWGRAPRPPQAPPLVSGALPLVGHMLEFSRNPFAMLMRARAEQGEVAELKLLNQSVVMITGPRANDTFFRAPDDQLCRREAYKVMTPIFGEGVVFDAPVPRMNRQLLMIMPMLRDAKMRTYPALIAEETERLLERWGDKGELDILAFMKELTIYTSTRCLIGEEFRRGITEEFFSIYHDLEEGVDALAYLMPNLPLPKFRRRDAARARLQGLIEELMAARRARTGPPIEDGLQTLIDSTYEDGSKLSANELTGILIALILAGHHTSAGTAVWMLIEMLRHPSTLADVLSESDTIWSGQSTLTYAMLREMTSLGAVVKEVLRLHPPLIFLFRKVLRELRVGDYVIPAGALVCAAPAITHRIGDVFPDPESFAPERYTRSTADDPNAWISFGGGKHKCTGNAFGVLQLKTIVTTILRRYELELVDAPASYHDDYTRPTVQPHGPCRLRYRRRDRVARAPRRTSPASASASASAVGTAATPKLVPTGPLRVTIDRHRCQGHAVCVSEAPGIFRVGAESVVELANRLPVVTTANDELIFEPAIADNARIVCAAQFCPNHAIRVEAAT